MFEITPLVHVKYPALFSGVERFVILLAHQGHCTTFGQVFLLNKTEKYSFNCALFIRVVYE
ncbi:hypothetical protein OUZ56_000242 [Daphnia magna]|uniref:Uncharacterized protein n=1 Tax=Daphnia magna TaxID=35525 RepID=A0ABQ9ZZ86_9CRUS|nr:hypothetical protein OUZ56_000242 [Daphnia magna]